MRIVHVITRLIVGGAQENTLLSCEGQHDRGHDVTLITGPALGPEGSLMERAKAYGYRVEVVDEMRRSILPVKDWRTYRRLVQRIRELSPDVVHTHSSKAGIIGRWAAAHVRRRRDCGLRISDCGLEEPVGTGSLRARGDQCTDKREPLPVCVNPQSAIRNPQSPGNPQSEIRNPKSEIRNPQSPRVVHTIHGLAFTASTSRMVNSIYKLLERRTAPITDRIVCVADAMREQSLAARIGTASQYVTVYSGMRTEPFLNPPVPRAEVRRQLGLADDHVAVGTIARLFHLKGHEDLLAAAPRLCAAFPNLRFLWVGDGLLRAQFERQIAAMGLTGRFILTGLVPPERIPELTNAMDILVHPSRREGLARALPQGALARCPVITYDIDGNREGLIDGQTGFLAPAFDTAKLEQSIHTLMQAPDLRLRMGEAGRAFALGRFDAKVMVDALEDVYESAR